MHFNENKPAYSYLNSNESLALSNESLNMGLTPGQEFYQIRLKTHLDLRWSDWFDKMVVSHEENGDTILTGPVTDQAALHGLLNKVRDLSLTLVSVERIDPKPE